MRPSIRRSSALAWTLSITASCIAQSAFATDDFLTLDLGAYRFDARNELRIDAPTRRGTAFRVERTGTPDNDKVLRLDGTIRPSERHRIRFMYFNSRREGSRTLDREINIRDSVISIGATTSSSFDMRQAELAYLYSFWKSNQTELAVSLGLHWTRMEAEVNAPAFNISESAVAEVPVPMIGFAVTSRIGDKWELFGNVSGVKASVEDFDGSVLSYRIGGRYFITPNSGLGLAVAGINYDFDVSKARWQGALDASNHGAQVFWSLRF